MTLPSTIILPLRQDFSSFEDVDRYFRDYTFELQRMYEDIAQAVNGSIRSDAQTQQENWKPILKGTTVEGTFTYNHQIGTVLRKGLIVDCWFDVSWSALGTAAGNLYIELPYKVALTAQKPFVGVIQASNLAYTAGTEVVINAVSDTFRGEIWYTGDGIATANQIVTASGQLLGHIRYLGQANE